ncbi:MAG: hypothetical protein MI862_26635 [Desulfobacterales bacterium]|nr:hypothetical protein [Desulfobacterales bacterium]
MSILDLFKRKRPVADVEPGRNSVPRDDISAGIGRLTNFYGIHSPKFPLEYLDVLEVLSIWNPDISQALSIIVNLGNTGHEIQVEGGNAEAVVTRLNELAGSVYRSGGGMDGLVNHFLRQIAMMGALSGEWVVADNVRDGIRDAVVVPVRTIRFKRENGAHNPYQITNRAAQDAYVALNSKTFSYAPVQTMDDSPYGIPGFYSVLKNIEIQLDSVGGLAHIIRKMGLLGFLDVSLKTPDEKAGETDAQRVNRLQNRLEAYAKTYIANFSKGVAVHYDDQVIKHNHLGSTAAAGAKAVFNLNEEQIFSGLDIPPSMAGRSYSTTETYAEVDYERFITRLSNYRRLIKRFMEKGYGLDLALSGINAAVSVTFNENSGFKEGEKAEADGKRIENVVTKRDAGFISDDEAARELGYEKATGQREPEPALNFSFNTEKQRYEFIRPVLPDVISSFARSFARDRDKRVQNYAEAIISILEPCQDKAIQSALKAAEKAYDSETQFSKAVIAAMTRTLLKRLKTSRANQISDQYVKNAWQFYRHEDNSDMPKKNARSRSFALDIGLIDTNAVRYLTAIDRYYFGSGNYLANNPNVAGKFITWLETEYIDKGLNIRDEKTMAEFRSNFTGMVKETTWQKINQLVTTTMARVQNFGQTMKLYEAGFEKFRIVGPKTYPICEFCAQMVGRVFEVKKAARRLSKIVEKGFEDPKDLPPFLAGAYPLDELEKMTDEQLQDAGFESPPYHPECRHRKAAES